VRSSRWSALRDHGSEFARAWDTQESQGYARVAVGWANVRTGSSVGAGKPQIAEERSDEGGTYTNTRMGQCSGNVTPTRADWLYVVSRVRSKRIHQPRSLAEELDERALVPEGIEITVFHSDLAKAGPPLERNA
jgi:hypothetical protein